MDLSAAEIRVLGCLLEKQRTTPDHYPLSLNSLRLACNQSTNRDPVVAYEEAVIRDALHRLGRRGYVRLAGASRAAKYRHLLSEALPMSDAEQASMCVLMLRGPQTPGEIKQRGERMHPFADLHEVHDTLAGLIERGLAVRMERRPGQKEERYMQLLGGAREPSSSETPSTTLPANGYDAPSLPPAAQQQASVVETSGGGATGALTTSEGTGGEEAAAARGGLTERVARLEGQLAELQAGLAELRAELGIEEAPPSAGEEAPPSAGEEAPPSASEQAPSSAGEQAPGALRAEAPSVDSLSANVPNGLR